MTQPVAKRCSIVGTIPYLSSEQARGLPLDVRSDLYAVGVILFELLRRRRDGVLQVRLEVVTDPSAIAELLHGARAPPRPYPPGPLGLFA